MKSISKKAVALTLVLLLTALAQHNDAVNASPLPASAAMPRWVKRQLLTGSPRVDAVVAQDGSGGHSTINAALKAAPPGSERFTIHVKKGVYAEVVEIHRKNVMLVGDGAGQTIITGNRSNMSNHGTPCTATVSAQGSGFIARELTIENTAGPTAKQAVALLSNSNHSVVFRCEIKGYQDTLLAENHLQFYRDCEVSGTIDIVFGDAAQRCSRTVPSWRAVHPKTVTTSSRPRGAASPTPRRGWVPWDKNVVNITTTRTVFYGEYKNEGPGSDLRHRVSWPGFHKMKHAAQARKYTVDAFIHGGDWLPEIGVAYKPGL
ncbi:hypothetical protein PR202_gb04625 [Eleusine coracana subsp. coracana]|uniref:Pectinesterase n=1 Tax=Eleusine coracana subsp. coracana TaxID=191504 RepID=A0AAV5E2K8_ELECO|nr:hypothetical protein PR202_gb04625 [Eleusine coracana subsp. coracana]